MKFELFFIGKTNEKYLATGIESYLGRLNHYCKTEIKIIPLSIEKDRAKVLIEESGRILKLVSSKDFLVILDEQGKQFSSVDFSKKLQLAMNQSYSKIIFVIGSAYGIDAALKERAKLILAFSKFTFTHQMIRLILIEQVYRSMTILKGESYHHD